MCSIIAHLKTVDNFNYQYFLSALYSVYFSGICLCTRIQFNQICALSHLKLDHRSAIEIFPFWEVADIEKHGYVAKQFLSKMMFWRISV